MQYQSVESKQLPQLLAYVHGTVNFCSFCLKTENEAKLEPNRRQEMLGPPFWRYTSSWLCSWCEMRCRSFERLRKKAQSALAWLHHIRSTPHIVQNNTDCYWTAMQEIKQHDVCSTTRSLITSYINPEIEEEEFGNAAIDAEEVIKEEIAEIDAEEVIKEEIAEIDAEEVIKEEIDIEEYIKQESSLSPPGIQEGNILGTSPQLKPELSDVNYDNSNECFPSTTHTYTQAECTASSTENRPSLLAEMLQQPFKAPVLTSATENVTIDDQMRAPEHQSGCSGMGASTESEGTMFTLGGRTITPICTLPKTKAMLNVANGREDYKLKPGDTTITLDENNCIMSMVADLLEGRVGLITLSEEERRADHAQVLRTGRYQQASHRCEPCALGYQSKHLYSVHMNQHVKKKNSTHRCTVCTTYHASAALLQRHTSEHYTRYYCGACSRMFRRQVGLVDHYFSEHMSVDFTCKYCDTTSRKPFRLRFNHMARHLKVRSIACPTCHTVLSSERGLQQHMRIHKPEDYKWHECPICHKKCPSAYKLKNHMSSHEPTQSSRIQCHLCHNMYTSELGLQSHMQRKHSSDTSQRYKCDECGKEFKVKADMTQHIVWTHMKLGGAQCPHCAKKLHTPCKLRDHIRRVHEKVPRPRNNLCDVCGKGYGSGTQLLIHRRVHTGERPYTCAQCGQTFGQKSTLTTHIKLKHLRLKNKKQLPKKKKKDTVAKVES